MAIRHIRVRNFKSFRDAEVQLSPLTALVGANASGKSNFVQLFRFLRDIAQKGLENAIALQGGAEYLLNMQIGNREPLEVEIEANTGWSSPPLNHANGAYDIRGESVRYSFRLEWNHHERLSVQEESFILRTSWRDIRHVDDTPPKISCIANVDIVLSRQANVVTAKLISSESSLPLQAEHVFGIMPIDGIMNVPDAYTAFPISWRTIVGERIPDNALLIELDANIITGFWRPLILPFAYAGVYDFRPESIKRYSSAEGVLELQQDGSNLPIVLRRILQDPERARQFRNLLSLFLPFVRDVQVQSLPNQSLMVTLQEEFGQTSDVPASFVSDGTVELVALITALYFTEPRLVQVLVLEEPDRNLHPRLAERLVGMMQEVSQRRQVIFTTHNAEVVRHLPLESLLLVSRDREGFSTITRPADSKRVREFLKEEIGASDLFVKELLDV